MKITFDATSEFAYAGLRLAEGTHIVATAFRDDTIEKTSIKQIQTRIENQKQVAIWKAEAAATEAEINQASTSAA